MAEQKKPNSEKEAKELKINRVNPNGITPIHVNDMLLSHDGKEFYIHFAEIEPPALIDQEEFDKLVAIDAVTKVKLVMSPQFLEAVAKTLTENLEKFKLANKEKDA